jgi:hypothetical protein
MVDGLETSPSGARIRPGAVERAKGPTANLPRNAILAIEEYLYD